MKALQNQIDRVLARVIAELASLCPGTEWHHIGATAIPTAITKGDVDILLRTSQERFSDTISALKRRFVIKQPENWTATFASFGNDTDYELPLGIQVVVADSADDFLLYLHDYFASNPQAVINYNDLKRQSSLLGHEAYWRAKDTFFTNILAQRETP